MAGKIWGGPTRKADLGSAYLTVALTTCSVGYVTDDPKRDAFEYELTRWARRRREIDEMRDGLVRGAIATGISKHRVHVLTGIARTTINKITKAS